MAQTSDWAQQEEEGEEEEKGNEEGFNWAGEGSEETEGGVEARASSNEGDGWRGEVEDGNESSGDGVSQGSPGEFYPEPPEEAKLFVGNLPYDVDSEKLAQIFNDAGVVEIAEVKFHALFYGLCMCGFKIESY